MSVTWALPFEKKINPKLNSNKLVSINTYKEIHSQSVKDYKQFWASIASEIDWFKPWERVIDDSNPPFYKWFVGGEINASYLAVDRHANSWRKNKVAIIWEGEPVDERGNPREVKKLSYYDLYREVNGIALPSKGEVRVKERRCNSNLFANDPGVANIYVSCS